jgi:O-antigen/teichoic acid export membrane protein
MSNHLSHSSQDSPSKRLRRVKLSTAANVIEQQATVSLPVVPHGRKLRDFAQPYQRVELESTAKMPVQPLVVPEKPKTRNRPWIPGTFGFDSENEDSSEFDEHLALPTMILKSIEVRLGQSKPAMQSEITGTAGAAAMVGMGTIFGSILKYGSNFLIQYGFGAASYGLYTLGLSLVTLVSSLLNLGLDDAMVRYVAIYRSKQQRNLLKGLTIFCTALAGIAGILGAVFLLFAAPFLAAVKHSPRVAPLLLFMAPMIPLLCMQVIWFGGLQGFKAFKWRVITTRLLQPLVLIILVGCILLFHGNVIGVALVTFISTLVSALFNLYFLLRMLTRHVNEEPEQYALREWIGFAAPNFLTAIVDVILESTDTLLLAFFAISNTEIGQYGAAIRISSLISLPLFSLNAMFTPTIAELHSKGETQKLTIMFKIVTKWAITMSLPICCIAVLFSQPLLILSGQVFASAWPLLIAFALGMLANVGTGSVGYLLLMTGHTKLSFLNSLVAVIVNVVLGVILTPRYGAMGTAISTGLAICVLNLMRLLQVRLLLKMQPYRWDTLKPLGAGLISAAIIVCLLYLLSVSHLKLSVQLGHAILSVQLLLIPVFLLSYVGLLSLFKSSPEDKIVVDALRKKLLRGKRSK